MPPSRGRPRGGSRCGVVGRPSSRSHIAQRGAAARPTGFSRRFPSASRKISARSSEHDPNRPARRVRLGIIPDALLRNVFLPTTTHSNVPLDVLVDFKTIVRCRSRYSDAALRTGRVSRATRNRRRSPPSVPPAGVTCH